MKHFFRAALQIGLAAGFMSLSFGAQPQPASTASRLADTPIVGSDDYVDTVKAFFEGREPKIVGGKSAPISAFPWQVSLGISWIADDYRAHFCGGSVYSATWIVTAAHCVAKTSARDVIVTAGTDQLGKNGIRRNVRRIIVKSDYVAKTHDNDIALLELTSPLPMDDITKIKAIALLSSGEDQLVLKDGVPLNVSGWGATQFGGESVRKLQFATIPLVATKMCNRALAYDGQITNNMICAGQMSGGTDSCQGDSGGPLALESSTNPRLAGIVSWGEGCARPNKVGVYTRVANYVSWVAACTASPASCP
jgi:secreted trypsin-like serine protease